MKTLWCVLGALLLVALPAAADPSDIRVLSTRAFAPNEMVKPVAVEVKVKNNGQEVDRDSIVVVRFVPVLPMSYQRKIARDMYSPYEVETEIGALAPGESRTIVVNTPYLSQNHFSTASKSFRATLVPELSLSSPDTVQFSVTVR